MPVTDTTVPDDLLERAGQLMARSRRSILGIAAPPGAGKSTLAGLLVQQLGAQAQLVAMDGFHLSNRELARLGRASRKGAPDTFDAAGYIALLTRLKTQSPDEVIYAPEFDRDLEESIAGSVAVLPDTRLLITEGNYLLLEDWPWHQVRGCLDECWYLEVPDTVRLKNLLARHMHHGRTEAQAKAWIQSTDEPNAVRIAASRHRADRLLSWL